MMMMMYRTKLYNWRQFDAVPVPWSSSMTAVTRCSTTPRRCFSSMSNTAGLSQSKTWRPSTISSSKFCRDYWTCHRPTDAVWILSWYNARCVFINQIKMINRNKMQTDMFFKFFKCSLVLFVCLFSYDVSFNSFNKSIFPYNIIYTVSIELNNVF